MSKRQSGEVILPVRIVLQTSVLVTMMLVITQMILLAWFHISNLEVSQSHITATAILTSVVAVPFITFLAIRNEGQRANLQHLKRVSRLDFLTGLMNRRSFEDSASGYLSQAGGNTGAGVFLYLDVDNFKGVNDRLGHAFGDAVLCCVGAAITKSIRQSDLAVRLGGDEFGVFLIGSSTTDGMVVAQAIQSRVREGATELGEPQLDVSISIGIAEHRPGLQIEDLMHDADRQLYAAKNNGRNTILAAA